MATDKPKPKYHPSGFPPLKWEEEDLETRPMGLGELPVQYQIDNSMAIINKYHPRIAKAIGVFWGHKDCVEYIEQLVLQGGDGAGHTRVGFKQEVLSALITLSSLHDKRP